LESHGEFVGDWISVNDKLPDIGVKVLCFCPDRADPDAPYDDIFTGHRDEWMGTPEPVFVDYEFIKWAVSHWMPLPLPPKY
jgi:hypothetical protein